AGLMLKVYQLEGTGPTTGTLDIDDQIGILEHELLNLCRHREAFDGIKIQSKPPKGTFYSDLPKRDMPPHMSDASGPATPSAATSPDPTTSTSGPTAVEKGKGIWNLTYIPASTPTTSVCSTTGAAASPLSSHPSILQYPQQPLCATFHP
ncbi:hypothetical protein DXG03_004129, partial [Asterophora parasitica]